MRFTFKSILSFFGDIVETIIIALAIFLVVYIFLVQPHRVSGDSMKPNFLDGELILTDKLSYRLNRPKRGDVIVFKAPTDRSKDFIKRVIGLPGERIKIENGLVFADGVKFSESYIDSSVQTDGGLLFKNGNDVELGPNTYLALGDNRGYSFDSREWGPLPYDNIVGKAWLIYWPINKMKFIPQAQY